ncbi:claw keratin-like [Emydura macquarii macquarii]|uniref:claw keratin-like n=1 Tax=Emydura macquarii macquarii TaxID=1129001 RepID=UPI00352B47C1
MSFNKALCNPNPDCYPDICPRPCIDVCNEPCISSCGDSTAVVYAPPVVVRFPGPMLATCPQDSFVGTALPNLPYGPGGGYGSGGGVGGSGSSYGGGVGGSYGGGFGGGSGGGFGGSYGGGYGGGYGSGYGGSCGNGGSYRSVRRSQYCSSVSGGGYSGVGGRKCGPC